MGSQGYRGYRVRKVGEVVVVNLRREKLLACSHQRTAIERRGSPLGKGQSPIAYWHGWPSRGAAEQS